MQANMLKMIMGDDEWTSIDITNVSRACSNEFEDIIEGTLRDLRNQQSPKEFDIGAADLDMQMTIAAYIKCLCIREGVADEAREYLHSMQDLLEWEPREEGRRIYLHPANDVQQKESMSVSVERDELPGVPEQPGPVRRPIRRARR